MIDRNYLVASSVPISANVPDAKINPYIPRATRELRGILDVELFAAIVSLSGTDVSEWSLTNSYVSGNRVLREEYGILKMWEADQSITGQVPSTTSTYWTEIELGTFLHGYVKPWLAHHVYVGYAVNGGVNVTHQGLQEIANETAAAVSGSKLDAYLVYWQAELRAMKSIMFTYLSDMNNTLDGVSYVSVLPELKTPSFQITAIGGKKSTIKQIWQ
jgi:hypothetical protein